MVHELKPRVLAVIPARGGSKGVPHKNIRDLCGAPLLAWTIQAARDCGCFADICVSTDDARIQAEAIRYGARAPFLRPAELATDRALAVPTIQHAALEMERLDQKKYDIVAMLQPTTPLRLPEDLSIPLANLWNNPSATGVISVVHVDNWHPMKMKKFIGSEAQSGQMVDYEKPPKENCPRQELPPVYMVNGSIYATRRDVLINENTFQGKHCLGYVMPVQRSVNIDGEVDFIVAEYEVKRQHRVAPKTFE